MVSLRIFPGKFKTLSTLTSKAFHHVGRVPKLEDVSQRQERPEQDEAKDDRGHSQGVTQEDREPGGQVEKSWRRGENAGLLDYRGQFSGGFN